MARRDAPINVPMLRYLAADTDISQRRINNHADAVSLVTYVICESGYVNTGRLLRDPWQRRRTNELVVIIQSNDSAIAS